MNKRHVFFVCVSLLMACASVAIIVTVTSGHPLEIADLFVAAAKRAAGR